MFALLISAYLLSAVDTLQNPYCSLSCDFGGGISTTHTVCQRGNIKCGPDVNCGPDFREIKLTNELRQYILDLHNKLRNRVALGNETRNRQPSAKNMMTMSYSRELEFLAQCWANSCHGNPLDHDVCRATKKSEHVGQNLGFTNSSISQINVKLSIHDLIMHWYNEVAIFKREWVLDTRDRGPELKVGHYTQMLWSETEEVGCGLAYYTTNNEFSDLGVIVDGDEVLWKPDEKWHHLILVCNYSPGGNYLGEAVYEIGEPCSGCPRGRACGSGRFRGLCGKEIRVKESADNFQPFFKF